MEDLGASSGSGLSVRLRWVGEARDVVVPAVEGIAECAAEAPAGSLVLGPDEGLANVLVQVASAPGIPDVPAEVTLSAVGCRFVPVATVIPPSTPIVFENRDSGLHTFHLWEVTPDGERSVQNVAVPPNVGPTRFVVKKAGRYRVTSDRFPHMEAWILVAPGGTAGVTSLDGRLELPELPGGVHTVELFHPASGVLQRQVVVPEDGPAALHIDLNSPGG